MRWAAVESSRGIGLPSAGIREVEEEFAGCEKRGGKVKGREDRLYLEGRLEERGRGFEAAEGAETSFGRMGVVEGLGDDGSCR